VKQNSIGAAEHCTTPEQFAAWVDELSYQIGLTNGDAAGPSERTDKQSDKGDFESDALVPGSSELGILVRLAREYAQLDAIANGPSCLGVLTRSARQRNIAGSSDAVELVTFHRAKGLEWPVVFVTGLEEGFVPISYAGAQKHSMKSAGCSM